MVIFLGVTLGTISQTLTVSGCDDASDFSHKTVRKHQIDSSSRREYFAKTFHPIDEQRDCVTFFAKRGCHVVPLISRKNLSK